MQLVEFVFWGSVGLMAYTLFGYPLLSLLLAAVVRREVDRRPITPRVSFIIAAYNEEEAIGPKIEQTLALDYPPGQMQIIVASDGSTDRTDEIVRGYADRGVVLHRVEGRRGKTHMLNETVAGVADGEILVFSDATGIYNPGAVRALAANFADPTVGCVTGRVVYRYGEDATSSGFRFYQKLAVAVRRSETRWGSQTSVSGSIHAMRRELYRPADPAFSLDVIDAVHTVVAGRRVVYENEATSLEESRDSWAAEFRCRVRIAVRTTSMIPYILRQLVGHGRYLYLFQMVSHKILRWWLWFLLLLALITNGILVFHGPPYTYLAGLQALFYAVGLAGLWSGSRGRKLPGASTVAFFLLGNAAGMVGAIKALRGQRMARWEPVRSPASRTEEVNR